MTRHWRFDVYPGGAWFICDRCGQRHRRSAMFTEWDGLKVDAKCLDPRPPQMQPPNAYPEGIPFPDARPPQDNPDRLMDDTYLDAVSGGLVPTDGIYPTPANGQLAPLGGLSPQPILVDAVPNAPPSASQLADDVTLRTGPVYAPSVNSPPDASPGAVPGPPTPPRPPF